MPSSVPQNANEFIEQQLDDRAAALEQELDADILGFNGGLTFGVDDVVRNAVESMRTREKARDRLAIVLTTLGGYIEVVIRIVETLRNHYEYVDFVVPNHAFSAGTVLVLSGDAIYMNYYSRLGPIDPQVESSRGNAVSAIGYLAMWERLLAKAQKGELSAVEATLMIQGFDQAELYAFEQARELSVSKLIEWLAQYKFKDWTVTEGRRVAVTPARRKRRARTIANQLNKTERWHSHGHGISMDILRRDLKLRIDDFDAKKSLGTCVRNYYNLLTDYQEKRGNAGALHSRGKYLPFM